MSDARQVLVDAEPELTEADRLLSIGRAAGWLQLHGVTVHVNTVRYWVMRGHLHSQRTARGHMGVRMSTLRTFAAHLQACPFCQRHAQ